MNISSTEEFPKFKTSFDPACLGAQFWELSGNNMTAQFLKTEEEYYDDEESDELMIKTIGTISKSKSRIQFRVDIDPKAPIDFGLYSLSDNLSEEEKIASLVVITICAQGVRGFSQENVQFEENCYEDMTGKTVTLDIDPESGKVAFQGLGAGGTVTYDSKKDYVFAVSSHGKGKFTLM